MRFISPEVEGRVRAQAGNRCGYCLSPQHLIPIPLEIEHIYPRSKGGSSDELNLWLGCVTCNRRKKNKTQGIDPETSAAVPIFNPRTQTEHFRWDDESIRIIGLTPVGRVTVIALNLNNAVAVEARRNWVSVGWHPPKD